MAIGIHTQNARNLNLRQSASSHFEDEFDSTFESKNFAENIKRRETILSRFGEKERESISIHIFSIFHPQKHIDHQTAFRIDSTMNRNDKNRDSSPSDLKGNETENDPKNGPDVATDPEIDSIAPHQGPSIGVKSDGANGDIKSDHFESDGL